MCTNNINCKQPYIILAICYMQIVWEFFPSMNMHKIIAFRNSLVSIIISDQVAVMACRYYCCHERLCVVCAIAFCISSNMPIFFTLLMQLKFIAVYSIIGHANGINTEIQTWT